MKTATPVRRPPRPSPAIDPRIRERRIAVTRDQGRRRLRLLIGVLGAATVTVLTLLVLHMSWFRVSRIEVRGAARTGVARVVAAAAGALHRPLISLDTAGVADRVERLPWVDSARITKAWPSTLVVTVVERAPVAQVADGAGWAQVDRSGRVLAVVPARAPGLVALAWTGPVPAPGARLPGRADPPLAVARLLAPLVTPGPADPMPVVSVAPDPGGGVALDLAGGAVVELGANVDLGPKLTALQTLESGVDLSGVRTIDLRVPGQPVLTRG